MKIAFLSSFIDTLNILADNQVDRHEMIRIHLITSKLSENLIASKDCSEENTRNTLEDVDVLLDELKLYPMNAKFIMAGLNLFDKGLDLFRVSGSKPIPK